MSQAGKPGGYVLNLRDASYARIGEVGGKAASLGEMLKAGLQVPNGFVITTKAFKECKDEPSKLMEVVETAFDTHRLKRVAVRSSAVGEDAGDASWAGQLETALNVSRDGLLDALTFCWNSMLTDRAQAYAEGNNITEADQAVAVVVQQMVDSDVSGVMFTANPITGDSNQCIIEAIYGLGELLVQGTVTPESIVVDRNTREVIEGSEHRQTKQLVFVDGSNKDIAIDKPGQILNSDHIQQLLEQGQKIEAYYGKPQDIEFAFKDGKLFIIQSRPITTLDK